MSGMQLVIPHTEVILMDLKLKKVQVTLLSHLIYVHGGVLDVAVAFLSLLLALLPPSLSLSLSLFLIMYAYL